MKVKSMNILMSLFLVTFMLGVVSADFGVMSHEASVTLSPEVASCNDDFPNNFTVDVVNTDGYGIYNVKVYKAQTNIVDLICGDAPVNWTSNGLQYDLYCEYVTDPEGINTINYGDSGQEFAFQATLNQENCISTFRISTLDNEVIITGEGHGEEKDHNVNLTVDCSAPIIDKIVNEPKILGYLGFDWIRQDSLFKVTVTDNGDCDLGLDSCLIEYTLDGVGGYQIVDADDLGSVGSWVWEWMYGEDSEHYLEITCYDLVGNMAYHDQTEKVDHTAPVTTKTYGLPNFALGGDINDGESTQPHYITTGTLITLDFIDPEHTPEFQGDCSIGVDKTYYKVCQESCYDEECGGCECDTDPIEYTVPFTINEESEHCIEFWSVDYLGNEEEHTVQCVYVEDQAPLDEKWIGEPAIVEIDVVDGDEEMYIVKIVNPSDSPVSTTTVFEGFIGSWLGVGNSLVNFAFSEDISYYFDPYHGSCDGLNGNGCGPDFPGQSWEEWLDAYPEWMDWDSTYLGTAYPGGDENPVLTWDNGKIISPQMVEANSTTWAIVRLEFNDDGIFRFTLKSDDLEIFHGAMPEEYTVWVDQTTSVEIGCDDPLPHPVGNEEVCFKIGYDTVFDLTEEYCDASNNGWMNGDYCCESKAKIFSFGEDSMHSLEFYCEDALGNVGEHDIENFKVDSEAPVITRTLVGPTVGDCDQGDTGDCWIKDWFYEDGTAIVINAVDGGAICAVDQITCDWGYMLDGDSMDGGMGLSVPFEIKFYEDTQHEILVECCDVLGNCESYNETLLLDSVGPVVDHEFFGPYKVNDNGVEWIDGVSTIELTGVDRPFESVCAVGEDEIYYVVSEMDDSACWSDDGCMANVYDDFGAFTLYDGAIGGIDESCHMIEYYGVDLLGNMGPMGNDCFFVDKTIPNAWHVNDVGMIADNDLELGNFHWMTTDMSIDLYCEDQEPHPSNDVTLYYRTWDDVSGVWSDWMSETETETEEGGLVHESVTFGEDSVHEIEYYCVDAVNKTSDIYGAVYRVDTTAPSIDLILNAPYSGDCDLGTKHDECFVDTATTITLDVIDGGDVCHIDQVECRWRYEVTDEGYTNESDWFDYEGSINFPEESYHQLYVECSDALGNTASVYDYFSVDKTAPSISVDYGFPYQERFFEGYSAEYISSETPVEVTVKDIGDHLSGVNEIKYGSMIIADNEECKNYDVSDDLEYPCDDAVLTQWENIDDVNYSDNYFEFRIPEDSCHLIEVMSTDNVGKCRLEKKFVYVDNQAPTPNKTVGELKDVWDGVGSLFYETFELGGETVDLVDFCLIEGNCWEVTLDTPISMSCNDPEPHPVENERVCFNVELDGDDWTGGELGYCNFYDGDYNESGDGYCCFDRTVGEDFRFLEFSEHNLKFYCEDALGNKGPIDDEKFKVDGEGFEIQLNKKWNLISVPVVLLNDDPDEVFKNVDVDQCIQSVWAYDGMDDEWTVWTLGNAPDNLRVEPGYGYWVVANTDCMLTIGGSLLSPGRSPPERDLVSGWNLVGYYGMKDINGVNLDGYYGPQGNGRDAYCAFYSLTGGFFGNPQWSEVSGYWELNNHDNNPNTDTFEPYSPGESLDAGAGYWIFMMDGSDVYAPSSICWDKNEMPGGWLA